MLKYIYEVPIVKETDDDNYSFSAPKLPKGIGFSTSSELYNKEKGTVRIKVTIGGHNYLKNRKYAKFIEEVNE